MALRFKLQLVVVDDDDQPVSIDELVVLNKDHERLEHLGLTLAEAKALLLELQRQILNPQMAAFLAARVPCPRCGRARGSKDHKRVVFRTLFGALDLASPRLRRCPCQRAGRASLSPLVGASVPTDGPARRFGFVQGYDPKPRRHLAAVLRSQGLQHHQELICLSDGEERLRQLQCSLRPHSQHWLDWFQLTLQLTNLGQSLKGLAQSGAGRRTWRGSRYGRAPRVRRPAGTGGHNKLRVPDRRLEPRLSHRCLEHARQRSDAVRIATHRRAARRPAPGLCYALCLELPRLGRLPRMRRPFTAVARKGVAACAALCRIPADSCSRGQVPGRGNPPRASAATFHWPWPTQYRSCPSRLPHDCDDLVLVGRVIHPSGMRLPGANEIRRHIRLRSAAARPPSRAGGAKP
jgi:hypothetical protein